MSIAATFFGPALADLAKLVALPLPPAGAASTRAADQVALTPPATAGALRELASNGLQQLVALLPTLQRMVPDGETEPLPLPLGHLARAIGDAAHWIESGYGGLSSPDPAKTAPEPNRLGAEALELWGQTARAALHDASDLLMRAEQRLEPAISPELGVANVLTNPAALWALSQVVGAQRHVGSALGRLSFVPKPALREQPQSRRSLDLYGATAILGMVLTLMLWAFAYGMWLTVAGLLGMTIAAAVALVWGWRIVSARRLRLELRR